MKNCSRYTLPAYSFLRGEVVSLSFFFLRGLTAVAGAGAASSSFTGAAGALLDSGSFLGSSGASLALLL